MKLKFMVPKFIQTERTIQSFGRARLVRHANGRHELIGGTRADLTAAREWISLFGHEIVLSQPANSRRAPMYSTN
jgi:hypothetical protein